MNKPGQLNLILFLALTPLVVAYFTIGKEDPAEPASQPPTPDAILQQTLSSESAPVAGLDEDYLQVLQEGLPTPGCEDTSRPPLKIYDSDYADAERLRASEILSTADDPSLILASALLSADEDERIRRLHRSFQMDPSSRLAMWHLVQECFDRECGGRELLDEAVRVDGDNAAIWIERARKFIQEEEWEAAEEELRQGIAAPRYDIYFFEEVMLVDRALAAGSSLGDTDRSVAAFGIAAAIAIPQYGDITNACKSESNDTSTWASLCDQIGEVMMAKGGTMIDHAIGIELRRNAAERVGDQSAVARFQQQRDVIKQLQDELIMSGAAALSENDYAFQSRYLDYFAAYGELEAFRHAAEDARRLRADPTYDQCNFVLRRAENP